MSDIIRVSKVFTFDMAHALFGYDGPCKNIHGHTYRLTVTLAGVPLQVKNDSKNGMVIDFTVLKTIVHSKIINVFDHALVLNSNSPHRELDKSLTSHFEKIIYFDEQPTCENLLIHFKNLLLPEFSSNPKLIYVRLEETPSSYAEWYAGDRP
ncbi:MAG: 6-carboxytetrahydropterin synthase [Bacteroidetes bacterium]|jgi:6-pyruvoyltetrahydropterin/6-carboxytetrahydropterin synthase|nr:6-carboxytetrahydropterin synthase [Bacteroidota bacterium]